MSTDVLQHSFPHDAQPFAIGIARREVEHALEDVALDEPTVADLSLLVSELVTNAVRHAGSEHLEVRLAVRPDVVRLEVQDDGTGYDPVVAPSDDGSGGYGLFLVDELADRWGVTTEPGATTWLEFDR